MLREMRPSELGRWAALYGLDPWGDYRADVRAGLIAASLAPAWLKKKDGGAFAARDFMPRFDVETEAENAALSKRLRAALGGTKKRGS